MKKIKLFLRFAIIGALVFLIEALILFALTHELQLEPKISRCISFAPAVMSAWFLNRQFTFTSKKYLRWYKELMRYIIVNLGGLSSNFITYLLLLYWFEEARTYPVLALAGGSLAGMLLNFFASKRLVFVR
jgi:putative flippase GtrA